MLSMYFCSVSSVNFHLERMFIKPGFWLILKTCSTCLNPLWCCSLGGSEQHLLPPAPTVRPAEGDPKVGGFPRLRAEDAKYGEEASRGGRGCGRAHTLAQRPPPACPQPGLSCRHQTTFSLVRRREVIPPFFRSLRSFGLKNKSQFHAVAFKALQNLAPVLLS